jgi:hypothetical protein
MANERSRPVGQAAWALTPILKVLAVTTGLLLAAPGAGAQDSTIDTALSFFTRHSAAGIEARLEASRPAPPTPAQRALVLSKLPAQGEISHLNASQRQKLAAVRPILQVHGRETVYVVKVVDVACAFVGLHARSVVLVSELALDLLDALELQAFVAHEIGHEYFWNDYVRAQRVGDRPGLRRLELLCDGFAIITLRRAGTDPAHLTAALEKTVAYNRARFGAPLNEDHYPVVDDRRKFAERLVAWLGAAVS